MMRLYGAAASRASRSLLVLEELGLAYEHVPLKPWESADDRARLVSLNPNARVPVLDDRGLIVWESIAINLYLGDHYGGPLWPGDPATRAHLYQWSIWAQTSIDVMARHKARFSKDEAVRARAEAERIDALRILDDRLGDRPFLLGETFTLVDLNVAATLSEPWENGLIDGTLKPADVGLVALGAWLTRCTERESFVRVRKMP